MTLFDNVLGLILGGFIWFFLSLMFEEFAMRKIKEKKFGIDSSNQLSKEDRLQFYIPLGILSGVLGLIIAFLGVKGLLSTS